MLGPQTCEKVEHLGVFSILCSRLSFKSIVVGSRIFCNFQVEQVHDFFGSPPLPTEDTGEKCLGRRMYICALGMSGIRCGMNKEPFL